MFSRFSLPIRCFDALRRLSLGALLFPLQAGCGEDFDSLAPDDFPIEFEVPLCDGAPADGVAQRVERTTPAKPDTAKQHAKALHQMCTR